MPVALDGRPSVVSLPLATISADVAWLVANETAASFESLPTTIRAVSADVSCSVAPKTAS